jgi:hypothetical protein
MNIRRHIFEESFVKELSEFKPDPDKMVRLREAAKLNYLQETETARTNQGTLTKALEEVTELRRQVALKTAKGVIPDDLGAEQIQSLTADMGKIQLDLKKADLPPDELVEALDFAEHFFERLPEYWKEIDIRAQKKLQTFFFPEGLVAEKAGNLRTADYPLLEEIKVTIHASSSNVVDQIPEIPSDVSEFVLRLRQEFHDEQ